MKVIREQLIEAAKTYTDFQSKYNRSALNEKTNFFWSVFFTVFFRLSSYESIAAIFWQSASYVFNCQQALLKAKVICIYQIRFRKALFFESVNPFKSIVYLFRFQHSANLINCTNHMFHLMIHYVRFVN